MIPLVQVIFGTIALIFCVGLHIFLLLWTVNVLKAMGKRGFHSAFLLLVVSVLMIVLAHTIQVWFWAICFVLRGSIDTWETAIYFSLVTYTTLGYGDVTLDENHRTFAAMASVTGLLTFGLSTAFLVGLFNRLLPRELNDDD